MLYIFPIPYEICNYTCNDDRSGYKPLNGLKWDNVYEHKGYNDTTPNAYVKSPIENPIKHYINYVPEAHDKRIIADDE